MRNKLITGLIAGTALGVVAGLLFAPKPGKESRRFVASRSTEIRSNSGRYIHAMRSWRKSKEPVMAGSYDWRNF
jgi:gas vesicle protein